jgi:alkanesulfonate monooxygenase SsuD/methylene tetrahydromethanopterin reductase-like flavin-dependent oxidoreductase (luciferase family)
MRVGLLYDLANPAEWARPATDLYAAALAQMEWAEALGVDAIWVTEHHFVEGYVSSPLPVVAAAAARTSRVALGTGILVAPNYHPVRLAEDAAIIDVLSGGRLELGLGLGWAVKEYETFGTPPDHRVAVMKEIVDVLRLAWADEPLVYRGRHFSLGPVGVLPKPVRRPSVPLWGGANTPEGGRRVGRWGLGLMWLDRPVATAYLEEYRAAGHPVEGARIEGYVNMLVCDDPARTWQEVWPNFRYQVARSSADQRVAPGRATVQLPEPTRDDVEEMRASGRILVATPEQAVDEILARAEGLPVHGVFCHNTICGITQELSDRHVELLATRVAPALRAAPSSPSP